MISPVPPASGPARPSRSRRALVVALVLATVVAVAAGAVVLLLPRIVEGLARREIARLSDRLPGTLAVEGVALQGSTAVTMQRLAWRDGDDWEAEVTGVRVDVDPFGFLVGGRRIERVTVQKATARLGDPRAPLAGPEAALRRLRMLAGLGDDAEDGGAMSADRGDGFRASRLPDLGVASVSVTAYVGNRTLHLAEGRLDLAPVKDESVHARRRLAAEGALDEGDGTVRRVEGEVLLGSGALESASLRATPSVSLPGTFGTLSAEGVAWAPGEFSLLAPALRKADRWDLHAERVSVRWEASSQPAPRVLLERLPPSLVPLATRLLANRTLRAVEILRPSMDVVMAEPPPPARPVPEPVDGPVPMTARIAAGNLSQNVVLGIRGPARKPNQKAPSATPARASAPLPALPAAQARIAAAYQEAALRLDALGESLATLARALPDTRLEVHGATVRTLEPDQVAPRPGQSLVNVEARVERAGGGMIEASLRFECPEAPADANEARLSTDPATGETRASVKASYLPLNAFRAVMPRWLRTRDAVLRQTEGTLHFAPASRRLAASGTVHATGLVLDMPAVASAPLTIPDASVHGALSFDWSGGRLDLDGGGGSLGRVQVPFELHASGLADRPRFTLKGQVERLAAQDVIEALPREVLGSLAGARLSGTFAATFDLDVDTGNLDALKMDIRPDVADVTTVSLGKSVDMELLQSVFLHRIEEGDGTVVDRMVGEATPEWVPLAEVPRYLVDALTTAEDATFFQHKGFSTVGIRRSVKVNLERGGFYQGASTLSQQLVKNLFLSREKTLSRKLQEVFLTWQLEQSLPKEKILELYLNVIEWGPNVWGLREAAGHYFAKRPSELTFLEAAYLVSIIPNPRGFHKHVEEGAVPPAFERRVKFLIEEMERRKLVSGEEAAAALEQHVRFAAVQPPAGGEGDEGDEPPDDEFGGE